MKLKKYQPSLITYEEIVKDVNNLDDKKHGTFSNIPSKRLKEASEICNSYSLNFGKNATIQIKSFTDKLKLVDITPIFEKCEPSLAKSY